MSETLNKTRQYRWLTAQRCYVHFLAKFEILIPGDFPISGQNVEF